MREFLIAVMLSSTRSCPRSDSPTTLTYIFSLIPNEFIQILEFLSKHTFLHHLWSVLWW